MAKKRIEEITDADLEKLSDADIEKLENDEEVDIPDSTSTPSEPPAEGKEKQQETPPETTGEQTSGNLSLDDLKKRLEELEKQNKGILRDLQEERKKRQFFEQMAEQYQGMTKQEAQKPITQEQKDELAEMGIDIPDDEVITGQQVKAIIKQYQKALDQKVSSLKSELEVEKQVSRIQASVERAKSKYKDYDEKVKFLFDNLTPEEYGLFAQRIVASPDPAETCYTFATKLQQLTQKPANEQAQTGAGTQKPVILQSSKGGSTGVNASKILDMSDKELEQLPESEWQKILR